MMSTNTSKIFTRSNRVLFQFELSEKCMLFCVHTPYACMPMWKWKSLQKWKSLMNLDYQHHAIVLDMIAVR